MIRSAKELRKCEVVATDGRVGSVDDFYFEVERWTVRYIVVDTGSWVKGRPVLISPMAVSRTAWDEGQLQLSISRDQVNSTPVIDRHLRSAFEVSGYVIRATDGDLGQVDDFLFDDLNLAVRYLVVDTTNWWFGRHVLVAPRWIRQIAWADRSVMTNVRRQRLKNAPEYDGAEHVDRQWEAAYYRHLQQPGYWLDEEDASAINAVQSYVRDEPDRHAQSVERRSRPR